MTFEIVWSRSALKHVKKIEAFLTPHSRTAADRTISRIERRAQQLAAFPELGPFGRERGTRELVVTGTNYIISYRVSAGQIVILAVVHSSRDWPSDH